MRKMRSASVITALAVLFTSTAALAGGMTTFDNGLEGWVGTQGMGGSSYIDTSDGNPAPCYRTDFSSFAIFGITYYNNTNPAFIGDYTATPQVDFTIDTNARVLNFLGMPTPRDLIVELRDYDNPPAGYNYVSVWAYIGYLDEADTGWLNWTASIEDTSALELPTGWYGTGAEDPHTYEPTLPPDRTFTSVLAGVDEIAFTTFVPGWFYADSYYDVSVDNIGVFQVPEPGTAGLLLIGLAGLLRRR